MAGTVYIVLEVMTGYEDLLLKPVGIAEAHGPKMAMDAIAGDRGGSFVMVPESNWHELSREEETPPPRFTAQQTDSTIEGLTLVKVGGTRPPKNPRLPNMDEDDNPEED